MPLKLQDLVYKTSVRRNKYSYFWEKPSINRNFSLSPVFKKACELAKVEPTERQASKFRNKKGQAYTMRIHALKELNIGRGH